MPAVKGNVLRRNRAAAGFFSIASLLAGAVTAKNGFIEAQALHQRGELKQARVAYQTARDSAKAANDDPIAAAASLGLAQIDLNQGRYAECISEANAALARVGALPEGEAGVAKTVVGQARYFWGDSEGALADFDSALAIARKTHDKEAEITRLNNIGNVYFALGRYGESFARFEDAQAQLAGATGERWFPSRRQLTNANLAVLYQALGEYSRALQLYRDAGPDANALPPAERAQMLANMGTLYRRLGDPVSALERYRAAQDLYHQTALTAGELAVLNNIGIAYALDLGNPAAAIGAFTGALKIAEQSGGRRFAMTSFLYRGETFLRQGKTGEAEADFTASLRIATELNAEEEKWRADYGLARVAVLRGDMNRSDELLRQSIAVIERARKNSSRASGRSGFLIERRDVYDLLIEHLASDAAPHAAGILRLMEQSRARDLQDRYGAAELSPDEIKSRLPADTELVEYWLGAHALAAVDIFGGAVHFVYRRLPDEALRALTELPNILADPKRHDWFDKAQECSGLLLAGIAGFDDSRIRKLVIVPDGDLTRIPFEALPSRKALLIDRFSISYLPFGSAVARLSDANSARTWVAPWRTTLTAFANPEAAGRGLALDSEAAAALPNATVEVHNVAAAVGGRGEIHTGRDARKRFLMEGSASAAPLLHFATHAFADLENPDRSYILFASEGKGFDYLFLKEAASLRAAQGKLVTVSACDSGSGRLARGEGIQSFSSAFLSAGARAVVTSLWRVGDRPSAELMTRFYTALAGGSDAADALRRAKLAFRESSGASAHPAYWAAFVLAGDRNVKIARVVPGTIVGATALGALLIAALIAALVKKKAGTA